MDIHEEQMTDKELAQEARARYQQDLAEEQYSEDLAEAQDAEGRYFEKLGEWMKEWPEGTAVHEACSREELEEIAEAVGFTPEYQRLVKEWA